MQKPTLHLYLRSEFHVQFLYLISICQFSVKDICDSELSDDAVDPFLTQNRYIIPETNQQDEPVNDSDILETHSTSSEDEHRELNTAQLNLLQYLTEQKTNALKHEGMANHFSSIISSGASYPNFTKPVVNLHDQKYFSATCSAKLDTITNDFQKQICELLSIHHNEVAQKSKLLISMRLEDINSFYHNPALRKRLDRLSRNSSIENYTSTLNKANRSRGKKRPR